MSLIARLTDTNAAEAEVETALGLSS